MMAPESSPREWTAFEQAHPGLLDAALTESNRLAAEQSSRTLAEFARKRAAHAARKRAEYARRKEEAA
jgi:hypothetical protein